jgi:hypothetical protein
MDKIVHVNKNQVVIKDEQNVCRIIPRNIINGAVKENESIQHFSYPAEEFPGIVHYYKEINSN